MSSRLCVRDKFLSGLFRVESSGDAPIDRYSYDFRRNIDTEKYRVIWTRGWNILDSQCTAVFIIPSRVLVIESIRPLVSVYVYLYVVAGARHSLLSSVIESLRNAFPRSLCWALTDLPWPSSALSLPHATLIRMIFWMSDFGFSCGSFFDTPAFLTNEFDTTNLELLGSALGAPLPGIPIEHTLRHSSEMKFYRSYTAT